jgi:ubiquinone/menaquinone biosynthesis C-methylase UbiE
MKPEDAHYIHGTRPEEQQRLSVLNRLLNEASLRQMRVQPGERILDVGSGLGQLTRALARAAGPAGHVVGVERDPEQMREALRQAGAAGEDGLVDFRVGGAVDLPLDDDQWGTFDIVHARFLLEHVPDPPAVVGAMVRAARPGGRIVLEDDDHDVLRFFPELPETRRLWEAYFRTYAKFGRDPYVGRRLVAMLHEAGATPSGNTWLFFGSCAGSPNFDAMVANFVGVLEGARESVLAGGELPDSEIESGITALKSWSKRPEAALWYATCWAEAHRP